MSDPGPAGGPPSLGALLVAMAQGGGVARYRFPPTPREVRQREAWMIYQILRKISRQDA